MINLYFCLPPTWNNSPYNYNHEKEYSPISNPILNLIIQSAFYRQVGKFIQRPLIRRSYRFYLCIWYNCSLLRFYDSFSTEFLLQHLVNSGMLPWISFWRQGSMKKMHHQCSILLIMTWVHFHFSLNLKRGHIGILGEISLCFVGPFGSPGQYSINASVVLLSLYIEKHYQTL